MHFLTCGARVQTVALVLLTAFLVLISPGAFAGMAALSYMDRHLVQHGLTPLTIGPTAAIAVILTASPNAPVAAVSGNLRFLMFHNQGSRDFNE